MSTKEVGLLRETLKGPSQSSHSSIQPDSKPTEGNMTNSDDNGELSGSYDKPHMWIKSSHGSSRDIIYALLKKSGKVPVLPNAPPPLQPSSRLGSQTLDTECPKEASQTSGSSSLSGRVFRPQEVWSYLNHVYLVVWYVHAACTQRQCAHVYVYVHVYMHSLCGN